MNLYDRRYFNLDYISYTFDEQMHALVDRIFYLNELNYLYRIPRIVRDRRNLVSQI
jgi:hypothetical protein